MVVSTKAPFGGSVIVSVGALPSRLVPARPMTRYDVGLLASVTLSDVSGVRTTARSSEGTVTLKSAGPATMMPLTAMEAEETR